MTLELPDNIALHLFNPKLFVLDNLDLLCTLEIKYMHIIHGKQYQVFSVFGLKSCMQVIFLLTEFIKLIPNDFHDVSDSKVSLRIKRELIDSQ